MATIRFLPHLFCFALIGLVASSCLDNSEKQLKWGSPNWRPKLMGGDLVLRPLPASDKVIDDYTKWNNSDSNTIVRSYEIKLDKSNQQNFRTQTTGGDTPMGYTESTWVEFDYTSYTNGTYEIFWSRKGRHNFSPFKVGEDSKTCWVTPTGHTNSSGVPVLKLIAFEGLEADWVIVAQRGSGK